MAAKTPQNRPAGRTSPAKRSTGNSPLPKKSAASSAAPAASRQIRQREALPAQKDTETEIVIGQKITGVSESKKKKDKHRRPVVRTIRSHERKHLPLSSLFMMVVCTILVMFTIINYVQINEYTKEVSALKREMSALDNEEAQLNLELEKKNDLSEVEEKAREMGMMGSENLIKHYVKVEKQDTVESYETEEEDLGVLATLMSAFGQNWRAYWNIFSPGE